MFLQFETDYSSAVANDYRNELLKSIGLNFYAKTSEHIFHEYLRALSFVGSRAICLIYPENSGFGTKKLSGSKSDFISTLMSYIRGSKLILARGKFLDDEEYQQNLRRAYPDLDKQFEELKEKVQGIYESEFLKIKVYRDLMTSFVHKFDELIKKENLFEYLPKTQWTWVSKNDGSISGPFNNPLQGLINNPIPFHEEPDSYWEYYHCAFRDMMVYLNISVANQELKVSSRKNDFGKLKKWKNLSFSTVRDQNQLKVFFENKVVGTLVAEQIPDLWNSKSNKPTLAWRVLKTLVETGTIEYKESLKKQVSNLRCILKSVFELSDNPIVTHSGKWESKFLKSHSTYDENYVNKIKDRKK